MHVNVTTPGLLFPAISLLLLAFTNRFLALAALIRELYKNRRTGETGVQGSTDPGELKRIDRQISNLRSRIRLIRSMQAIGIVAFVLCSVSMFAVFLGYETLGDIFFGASLAALVLSLIQSFREIRMSIGALEVLLEDLSVKSQTDSTLR